LLIPHPAKIIPCARPRPTFRSTTCFFFFQAEDGIRAGHVTGVQTCALPIYAVLAGLGQAAADIPRSVLQAILHPIQTAGQVTGIGNIPAAVSTMQDPTASAPERWDALARATPFNMGYAPERALLNATGARSE